jgi:tetratricopeptide (TPR) repeat protein
MLPVYLALKFIYNLKHVIMRLSFWLNSLVSIASIAIISGILFQAGAIAQAPIERFDWSTLYRQAEDYDSRQQYREAEAVYRHILRQPRPASMNDYMFYYIYVQLGKNLQSQGRFTEAIEVLQGVLKHSPDENVNVWAKSALEQTIQQQQESEQNIAKGLQTIQSDPTSPWGYRDLATGLAAQQRLEQGLTFLESRLGHRLTPEQAIALARAANDVYKYQQAIALYRQVKNRYPNYEPARQEWLQALDSWGRPEDAIAAYREVIKQQPSNPQLYRGLARNLERGGQLAEAISVYEQLLQQQSAQSNDYLALGRLLEETQQSNRALQIYLQGIQAFPDDYPSFPGCHVVRDSAYGHLVKLLASQNRLAQVLTVVEQFQPNPTAEMYFNLALALEYQGYRDQAAAVNRWLSTRYPNFEFSGKGRC